jgi:cysteine desulfurase/selenocysteine lyase
MDLDNLRRQFPLFDNPDENATPVYFDNACMTFRPRSVIETINRYYQEFPACGVRSNHRLADQVTKEVEAAREKIAVMIGAARKEEIVFTKNTTEGINLVAHSLDVRTGDKIILSDKEHNSNLVPWQILAKKNGAVIKIIRSAPDNAFDLDAFNVALKEGVKLVAMVMTSNLDGVRNPVEEIIARAHAKGALVLLDAAQAVCHERIDLKKLDADFLAFSGHKMLGPSGTGVLYGKYALLEKLEPFITGGETVAGTTYDSFEMLPPPAKFEAGLQDYAGLIGLGAAVDFLSGLNFEEIREHETELNRLLSQTIASHPKAKLIGPADSARRGSITSFYVPGLNHHQIALMLNQADIMVRSGQHCVHSWYADRKIEGAVRASLLFYNTARDIERFSEAFDRIMKLV